MKMKILNRKDFLAMPSGTVYSRFEPIVASGLEIKLDSLDDDWFYLSFIGAVECEGDDTDSFYAMIDGKELNIQPFQIRDGGFDEKEQFLVYSDEDVNAIVKLIVERK